jgi:hypothetical protein
MYAYVISAGELHQKIGITQNLTSRLQALQTAHYHDLMLVFSVEDDEAEVIERWAHESLKERRLRGEWFLCSREDAVNAVRKASARVADRRAATFEAGDVVVCVSEENDEQYLQVEQPKVGRTYTVSGISPDDNDHIELAELPNDYCYFWRYHFRKVASHTPEGVVTLIKRQAMRA